MQGIKPCLWFDTQAEEAARYYTAIFKNSRIHHITHYGKNMPLPEGTVMTVDFELDGQQFMALNGGPAFHFTEAISLVASCDSQAELDELWEKLLAGGTAQACGWLKDKYGLSWQIVPAAIMRLFGNADPVKLQRMMLALTQMIKLDLDKLQRAYDGTA